MKLKAALVAAFIFAVVAHRWLPPLSLLLVVVAHLGAVVHGSLIGGFFRRGEGEPVDGEGRAPGNGVFTVVTAVAAMLLYVFAYQLLIAEPLSEAHSRRLYGGSILIGIMLGAYRGEPMKKLPRRKRSRNEA
jgi:hypothetical protein